MHNAEASFATV